jgi:hypothetical protein
MENSAHEDQQQPLPPGVQFLTSNHFVNPTQFNNNNINAAVQDAVLREQVIFLFYLFIHSLFLLVKSFILIVFLTHRNLLHKIS